MCKKLLNSLKGNPILYRLASGSFWALAGSLTSRVFSLLSTIFIAKLLGVKDFGAYGMVQSTLEVFAMFAGLSLGATSSKYLAEYKIRDKQKAGRILSLTNTFAIISSGVIALVVYFSARLIAGGILMRSELAPLLSLGAIYLFISAQHNVQMGSLGGFEAFKENARISCVQGVLTPIFAIPLVYLYGLEGAVLSMITVSVAGYILGRHELKNKCREFNITLRRFSHSSFDEWPILLHFAIPSLGSGLIVIVVIWMTNALLVNQQNGYYEMGIFNAANQWRQFVIFIPNILSIVLLPLFSEVYGSRSKEDFRSVLQLNIQLTWVIALPVTVLIICSRELLGKAFGAKYVGVEILIAPLMITAFLNMMNNVVGTAIVSTGRMWVGAAFNVCWGVTMVLCSAILIPRYGAMGLAMSYLVAYLCHTIWQIVYTERVLAPQSFGRFRKMLLLTLFTLSFTYFLPKRDEMNILLNIFLSVSLVSIGSFPLLHAANKYFRRALNSRFVNGQVATAIQRETKVVKEG